MSVYEKYLWIIDILHRYENLSFDEINSKWERSTLNDTHSTLNKRTFLKYIQSIECNMGISIRCNRKNGYRYYIESNNIGDSLNNWLAKSISVNNTLCESRDLADRIMLEDIPAGQNHLQEIMNAMHSNNVISILYQRFQHKSPNMIEIHPYGIRLCDRRWYLIGYVELYHDIRTYALDRIVDIDFTERTFEYPADFKIADYFSGCCGVIRCGDVRHIRIAAYEQQYNYIDSLPIHESQKMIEINEKEDYAIFEYDVRPTLDFSMKIMSYGASVEVLEPEDYKQEIALYAKYLNQMYNK